MVNNRLRRLRTGAIDETRKQFGIFIYLWVLLSLFSFHKALVLNEEYVIYDQGFALINALALAKVILLGEYFHFGERVKDRPLIYPILFKSAFFAALLIFFHIIEETVIGLFHGKTFFQSIPSIDDVKLQGVLMVGVIMFVVLMPFFAFRELDRAIGTVELRSLLFGDKTGAGAGQFCAKIDPRPFQIMVDQNKSDLAEVETRFERDKALGHLRFLCGPWPLTMSAVVTPELRYRLSWHA
jgi:hypothetical protein